MKIMMAILKFKFIDHNKTKLILDILTTKEYLYTKKLKNKTIYIPNFKNISETLNNFKNFIIIKRILEITATEYLQTSVFYKVSVVLI